MRENAFFYNIVLLQMSFQKIGNVHSDLEYVYFHRTMNRCQAVLQDSESE